MEEPAPMMVTERLPLDVDQPVSTDAGFATPALPPAMTSSQQANADPLLTILAQDPAFVGAVKQQDVGAAAQAAFEVLKLNLSKLIARLKPGAVAAAAASLVQTEATGGRRLDGGGGMGTGRQSAGMQAMTAAGLMAGAARVVKPGDWIIIRGGKAAADQDLMGQLGFISKVEHSTSAVEVQLPKLGITFQLQQRYLAHVNEPPEALKAVRCTATGITSDDLHPHSRKRSHPSALDAGSLLGRGQQQQQPARIPPLVGRGLAKMKEVLRHVRKEMLGLEENIPWDCVEKYWKVRRPMWRKGLKAILADPYDSQPPSAGFPALASPPSAASAADAPPPVALVAGAMADLHEALRTDKGRGLFARAGVWEGRLCELADGGNNYIALKQLWDEMREGVQGWLSYAAGSAAASDFGSPNSTMGGDAQFFGMLGASGAGGVGSSFGGSPLLPPLLHPSSAPLAPGSYPPGLAPSVLDKLTYLAVRRAIAAMEAAALQGEAYVSQVPLDKILGPNQGSFAMVRGMMEQEKQFIAGRIHTAKAKQGQVGGAEPAAAIAADGIPQAAAAAEDAGGAAPMEVEATDGGGGEAAGNAVASPTAAPEAGAVEVGAAVVSEAPAVTGIITAAPPADAAPLPPLQPPTPPHSQVLEALLSPQLRAELQASCIGMFNEPDSEEDGGPEATDLED